MEVLKEPQNLRSDPKQVYRDRVEAVNDLLPANWKEIIIKHYPQYNTVKGSNLMDNVRKLRSSDILLTEIMERIAKKELV